MIELDWVKQCVGTQTYLYSAHADKERLADNLTLTEIEEAIQNGIIIEPAPNDAVVDEATLESYVGNYQLAPTFSIAITREGNKLFGQATGQPQFELFAESKTKFYLKLVDAQVLFSRNDKGEVDQLVLHQNGQDIIGKRIR